ncbi:Hypothetical protein R9X50_00618900 [Acrodontium crateriforme]|uniref:Geranylgeranyl transferase type-2 subunit alpha n=1 Tax=Acrodontium crateriforme TaxID=150365 RepID=A0AAQ3M7H7_9PEZI|nr:Hypothetical protein R9X50_00618900 [Acrodontium crateriforme]
MASGHGIPRVSGAIHDHSQEAQDKVRKQIDQYQTVERDVVQRIRTNDFSNDTLQLTSVLLKQNPEYYTVWNHRRRIFLDVFEKEVSSKGAVLDSGPSPTDQKDAEAAEKAGLTVSQREIQLIVNEDLMFLLPLLKQFPKCYWIWNHRAWLLATVSKHLPVSNALEQWQNELGLVAKMLALDSRNFHGWGYRREVVTNLETLSGQSMAEQEFAYATKMIQANLSNFSAWHARSQLIPRLLSERNASSADRKKLFDEEFDLITRALYTDPYDQSLWFYHQYLMSTLDSSNKNSPEILKPCTNAERIEYLEQELDSVMEMLDGAEDCKYIYQALLEYTSRYLEIGSGKTKVTTIEMNEWLNALRKIDPLREGRWKDLEQKMNL